MTLVVARKVNNEIIIVGDTKITNDHKPQAAQYIGGLKIVLLAPGLCVAFAGDVAEARDAIEGIYSKNINLFDKNSAIDYFLSRHRESLRKGGDRRTDFIVASICDPVDASGEFEKEIFRIANSNVEWGSDVYQIGDGSAFDRYQRILHGEKPIQMHTSFEITRLGNVARPGFDDAVHAAMSAIQGVIIDPECVTVDGYRTGVVSDENGFRYLQTFRFDGNSLPINLEDGKVHPIISGGAPEGVDIKITGVLVEIGYGIYPLYSITGNFGVIYQPEISFEPKIYSNISRDEFELIVHQMMLLEQAKVLTYQSRF